jgi:diguanylate cyclase (GGDEF)-like protein
MDDYMLSTGFGGAMPTGLPGGFFIYEASGDEKIIFAEPNVIKMYGCADFNDFLDHVGGTFKGMVHPDDLYKIENQIKAQTFFGEKRHDYVRYRIRTKTGEEKFVEDFGHLLHTNNGKSFFYVFIVDVDQNEFYNRSKNSYAEAEVLSASLETDILTGLFNMSFFYQHVGKLMNSTENRKADLSIIHFDISNFKLYNELHGFTAGDELLCTLSKHLSDIFEGHMISRFSNDHFFICYEGNRGDAVKKVEQVYKKMLSNEDPSKRVRIRAGLYYPGTKIFDVGLACDHARLACNSIKYRYDVYYCIYDDMLIDKLRKQQYVLDHIEEAIEKEYIKVFYQPVIRVKTGKICGCEALVRWMDPNIGMMNPGEFIETLEQFHLIHQLDIYVIKKVCEDHKRLIEAGEPVVPVSVNISRLDFELCDIFGILEEERAKNNVPRNMIDIEITESALNENGSYIKFECEKMRELGYKIWLDDFGSGYSSLNTIGDYDFDVLKLDLVFLKSFDKNPKTKMLLEYIIVGSRGMGLSPLCEGVEKAEHFEFLKKAGCDRAQGYFFGKPMSIDDARAYIRENGMEYETQIA